MDQYNLTKMEPSKLDPSQEMFLDAETNFQTELSITCPPPIDIVKSNFTSESSNSSECDHYDDDSYSDLDLDLSNNDNLDIMCMSPPGLRVVKNHKTSTKHGKPKKPRQKKTRHLKRPSLVNSASNLEIKEETNVLTDSLTEHQDKRTSHNSSMPEESVPMPISSSEIKLQSTLIEPKEHVKKVSHKPALSKIPSAEMDPFDRADNYKKISLLLKLALSVHNKNKHQYEQPYQQRPPPPTPSTSNINSPLNSLFQPQSSALSHNGFLASSNYSKLNQSELDNTRKQQADNVWKHIYDFFEHYDDRSPDNDLIDKRLAEIRSTIPTTINDIINSNFDGITSYMNLDIQEKLITPLDYSNLYESKVYIDQLCYLYWMVEEVINRIGYIESLYPSMRLLKENQLSYADPNFEATTKTLLLWYKTMTELMSKSDVLGKFLGFAKRTENLQYWTWYDQRLNFAHMEYENVHNWLNENFLKSMNHSLKASHLYAKCQNKPSTPTNTPQPNYLDNPPLLMKSQSVTGNNQQPLITKQNRQVSFELHASKTTADMLIYSNYNNLDNLSQSVIESSDLHNIMGAKNDDDSVRNSNILSNLSQSINSFDNNINNFINETENNEAANSLLTTASDFHTTFLSNHADHLKPAKLHHLNSFVSRSSKSNESPSPMSSSFYSSLQSNINNITSQLNIDKKETVGFTLNDSNGSESELQYDSTTDSPIYSTKINENQSFNQASTFNETPHIRRNVSKNDIKETRTVSETKMQREKIFSEFLHKRLRKHGLTKTCDELTKIVMDTLPHVQTALQIDYCEKKNEKEHFNYHLMPLHRKCREWMSRHCYDDETRKYGVRGEWFQKLGLPSFRPIYLHLASIILELMHLCIKMQIENKRDMKKQSNFKFSLLSIEVLTHECRECIEQAILVRQFYYHMVFSVFERKEMDVQTTIENDLITFDYDLKEIIDIYLGLVTDWVHDLVACTDTTKALYVLKDEWNFCKNNLYFVTASEDIYAKRFCTMVSSVNGSLVHILNDIDIEHKQPLMEYVANMEMLQDMNSFECDSYDEENQNSLYMEGEQDHNLDENVTEYETNTDTDNTSAHKFNHQNSKYDLKSKYNFETNSFDVNLKCNEFKEEINQVRKRCMKALSFCATLIGDLELAAKYTVTSKIQDLLDELKSSNHVLVMFTNPELQSCYRTTPNSSSSSFEPSQYQNEFPISDTNEEHKPALSFMIFVPQEFAKDKTNIARLLYIISAKDDYEHYTEAASSKKSSQSASSNLLTASKYVRRLSSSQSFFENNESHRNLNLNKLSKMANIESTNVTSEVSSDLSCFPFMFSPQVSTDGYLLYLQLPRAKNETWDWRGSTIKLYASLPVRRSLYQHKNNGDPSLPVSLILVVSSPSILKEKRIDLKAKLKGTVTLTREKTSFHPNIEYAIDELKDSILNLRKESVECIRSIEKDLKNTVHYDIDDKYHTHTVIDQRYLSEIWRVSYNFGIELQSECIQFMTQDRAEQFSVGLADFCVKWCEYIVDKTERGKGRTGNLFN